MQFPGFLISRPRRSPRRTAAFFFSCKSTPSASAPHRDGGQRVEIQSPQTTTTIVGFVRRSSDEIGITHDSLRQTTSANRAAARQPCSRTSWVRSRGAARGRSSSRYCRCGCSRCSRSPPSRHKETSMAAAAHRSSRGHLENCGHRSACAVRTRRWQIFSESGPSRSGITWTTSWKVCWPAAPISFARIILNHCR